MQRGMLLIPIHKLLSPTCLPSQYSHTISAVSSAALQRTAQLAVRPVLSDMTSSAHATSATDYIPEFGRHWGVYCLMTPSVVEVI